MKNLYAPWRSDYSTSSDRAKEEDCTPQECVFCSHLAHNEDEKYFIIKRFSYNFVMLNRYPYNAGHLLVIPCAHQSTLEAISPQARAELMEITTASIAGVKKLFKADGCNVGLNLGKAAGAGIPAHLHMHVLPRWLGDTNFMPAIAHTKPISFDMDEIYAKLHNHFKTISF